MKFRFFVFFVIYSSITLLAGCGGGGTGGTEPKNTLAEALTCIACHTGSHGGVTPGTQLPVDIEWKASTHNTQNGASCQDCHGSGYLHTSTAASCTGCHSISGQAVNPLTNPDASDMCKNCHAKVNPRKNLGKTDGYRTIISANGVPPDSTTVFTHFSTGLRTNYVSGLYQLSCRKCHNPHNTSFGSEQRKAWTESAHGNTRGLARIGLDAKTRGSSITLDQNINNYNFCVRCHTSSGFINFVTNDSFTDIRALPDFNGTRSNYPEYTITSGVIKDQSGTVYTYKDTSREATNCDVCHLDNRNDNTYTSSYSGTLRRIAPSTGVKIYYPYVSAPANFKTVTPIQFDTLNSSNLCLTCHSGRATGQTIRSAGLDYTLKPAVPSIHDFAGGAVIQGEKSAFLFYTDPLKYNTSTAHRSLNTDGNGPCISCHMPKVLSEKVGEGLIHSHLFRPVKWNNDDLNDDIIEITSNSSVCIQCHSGSNALTPISMNLLRRGYRVSLAIFAALRPSIQDATVVAATNDWTGLNTSNGLNITYGNATVPALGGFPAGAYTMGASYNYGFLLNEPSAYVHSPVFVRQLIYDSIDWLKNGASGFGSATSPDTVFAAINGVPMNDKRTWNKKDPNLGAILGTTGTAIDRNYQIYNAASDRDKALKYLCKDYVPLSNKCYRW